MTDQPSSVMQAYKRFWPLYWKVCLVGALLLLGFSFLMPTRWTASTTILPPDDREGGSGLSGLLQGAPISLGSIGGGNKVSLLFVEILQSRTLFEGVVDTLKLTDNPLFQGDTRQDIVAKLEKSISIDNRRSGTVTLSIDVSSKWLPFFNNTSDIAQQDCADIANACTSVLDRLNREKNTSRARSTRAYIERVIAQNKAVIDSLQKVKLEFQDQHKVLALEEQMTALVSSAVNIGTELATAELELSLVKQEFAQTSPQVELLTRKVSALREQYNKVQQGGITNDDGFSIPFSQIPLLTRTYGNLIRDLKIKEQLNAFLETQRMEQVIQEAKDVSTVVVLDKAIPPTKRTSPARITQLSIYVFFITLVFGVGIPVRQSLLTNKTSSAS